MSRPPARSRALTDLLGLLWRQALFAIPFALFFGLILGGGLRTLRTVYMLSAVFSYCIGFASWMAQYVLTPLLLRGGEGLFKGGLARHVLVHFGSAVAGAYVAAILIHVLIMPGFLGSPRRVMVMTAFTLIFSALIGGLAYAWRFYQTALQRARSEEELNLARRIQRGFLLSAFPDRPRLQVHATNRSSREVSGDFYDVVPAGEEAFLLAIADVSGKGVPAALLSSMLQASVRTQAGLERSTAAILKNVNRLVCESTSRQQFATFFLARVDERALTLTYSNAGHNPPLLIRDGSEPRALERGGTVVGMLDGLTFEEETVPLAPGDRVVLYTDGLSEAIGADGTMFGDERVLETVRGLSPDLSAEAVCDALLARLSAWLGAREAGDDVTVMTLRVLPSAGPTAGLESPRPRGG